MDKRTKRVEFDWTAIINGHPWEGTISAGTSYGAALKWAKFSGLLCDGGECDITVSRTTEPRRTRTFTIRATLVFEAVE